MFYRIYFLLFLSFFMWLSPSYYNVRLQLLFSSTRASTPKSHSPSIILCIRRHKSGLISAIFSLSPSLYHHHALLSFLSLTSNFNNYLSRSFYIEALRRAVARIQCCLERTFHYFFCLSPFNTYVLYIVCLQVCFFLSIMSKLSHFIFTWDGSFSL